ncbi:MAG: DUF3859 domain-containing protein [Acidobacteriota bacterium]
MRTLLILAASLLLSACSMLGMGEPAKQLEIVEAGTFKNGALLRATNAVPLEMGTTFGFRFRIADPKAQAMKVKIITLTPGLLDPSKPKAQLEYVTEATLQPGQSYDVFFTFSQPWELAPGHWELRVETEKGEALTQTFEVYNPAM